MSSGFALFKDAFTRLLDMETGREFNLLLRNFMAEQDMDDFVTKLEKMCMMPPERQELLAVVKNVLPEPLQQPYVERLGLSLMRSAEKQMHLNTMGELADRCYELLYLGSGGLPAVPKPNRAEDVEAMTTALASLMEGEQAAIPCRLELTSDSLRTIDTNLNDAIVSCSLEYTVYCGTLNLNHERQDEVLVIVYQDPIYEIVVSHYYSCSTALASEIVMAVLGEDTAMLNDSTVDAFSPEADEHKHGSDGYSKLKLDRFRLKPVQGLGAGQFGMVYLSTLETAGKLSQVAVKMCRADNKRAAEMEFAREAELMCNLSHPHVVSFIGACLEHKPWLLVLEFMPYGNLKNVLQSCLGRKLQLHSREMIYMCRQLAQALEYIHAQGLVHMDLAARNVLVGEECLVKLADFGQSQRKDDNGVFILKQVMRLSVRWMAPETLAGLSKVFSERTDVWGFAVTCWEIFMYGRLPFKSLKTEKAREMIMRGRARLTSRPPTTCPKDVWALLTECWHYDADKRPLFKGIAAAFVELENKRDNESVRDIGRLLTSN
eukprot:TRINITY_DN8474_c0_g1_i1.p1 TRINITY_DN8474_c0_g1~~TRINITY_DN8474_c0_g1_i1.p1  ORF type:complete len:546 (+),score=132.55 TRINITY_DN8474_c0_g1_i1:188-1825(+)